MEQFQIKILETFDPIFCCVCTQNGGKCYLNIFENVIVYRSNQIPLSSIINETLGLNLKGNSNLQDICENCKNTIVDFFIFKRRNEEARIFFNESLVIKHLPVKTTTVKEINEVIENDDTLDDQEPLVNETNLSSDCENSCGNNLFKELSKDGVIEVRNGNHLELSWELQSNSDEDNHSTSSYRCSPELSSKYDIKLIKKDEKTSCSETVRRKQQKRKSNPEIWIRNKRKILRNTGQAYVSSVGKYVAAKKMKNCCNLSCRLQCTRKIDEDVRLKNFTYFYELADIAKQRKFLYDHMTSYKPQQNKTNKKLRAVHRNYFLDHENSSTGKVQVCKLTFLNTFSISSAMIDTIYKKAVNEGKFCESRGKFKRKT